VTVRVCALVSDLMDRSKISAAVTEVTFVRTTDACADADVVIVDLARFGDQMSSLRAALPSARLICFGSHVDEASAEAARAAGADTVLPRSKFFRDVAAAIEA
jgi:DNA-binding NarL/FixJ family response regulator